MTKKTISEQYTSRIEAALKTAHDEIKKINQEFTDAVGPDVVLVGMDLVLNAIRYAPYGPGPEVSPDQIMISNMVSVQMDATEAMTRAK